MINFGDEAEAITFPHLKNIKENISNNKDLLKKDDNKYYQIDEAKNKELNQIFSQIKLKLNFKSSPGILKRDGNFYTISEGYFTMYNNKFYNKLLEIKLKKKDNIKEAIELDNKDIVFFGEKQLIIYRLKNEGYSLLQKIDENMTGFKLQMKRDGCDSILKTYKAEFIQQISGNRFICVSNYGFKIYSLKAIK